MDLNRKNGCEGKIFRNSSNMARIGTKLCQHAFQTIPDISFFDAPQKQNPRNIWIEKSVFRNFYRRSRFLFFPEEQQQQTTTNNNKQPRRLERAHFGDFGRVGGAHFVTGFAGIWHKRDQHPNTSKRVRMDPNTSKRVRTRPKASKNVRKDTKTFKKDSKMFEKVKKIATFSERFRTLPNASERIRTYPNASEKVRTGPNRSEHVRKL